MSWELEKAARGGAEVAVLRGASPPIADVNEAVDLIMEAKHELGCDNLAAAREAFADSFYVLSSRLAGEILQKFVNYRMRLAIFGDFSSYTSKPLQDFIRESNRGQSVFFLPDEAAAIERLAGGVPGPEGRESQG